jgi:hypothetical protein
MKISKKSAEEIADLILVSPRYKKGTELIEFFNEFGFRDVYDSEFGSRKDFSRKKIKEVNETSTLKSIIEGMLNHKLLRIDIEDCTGIAKEINQILRHDDYEVVRDGQCYKVRELSGAIVEVEHRFEKSNDFRELEIEEQIQKCINKIESEDYSGAITNARSLVENVCVKILNDLEPNKNYVHKSDLITLFNEVRKLLNLDPNRKDLSDALKQVITGLSSIVNGLAKIRNDMSDSHALTYKPSRHHALLVVNSAKTLVNFLFDTMSFQREKGSLNNKK